MTVGLHLFQESVGLFKEMVKTGLNCGRGSTCGVTSIRRNSCIIPRVFDCRLMQSVTLLKEPRDISR